MAARAYIVFLLSHTLPPLAVSRNEFVSIGESAISQWGYTDGSPVPGMGLDATAGNQPRGTQVSSSYTVFSTAHGALLCTLYACRSPSTSCMRSACSRSRTPSTSRASRSATSSRATSPTMARAPASTVRSQRNGECIPQMRHHVAAPLTVDDGMGGGSSVTRNVLFNFCRESSDHGPFNSCVRSFALLLRFDPARDPLLSACAAGTARCTSGTSRTTRRRSSRRTTRSRTTGSSQTTTPRAWPWLAAWHCDSGNPSLFLGAAWRLTTTTGRPSTTRTTTSSSPPPREPVS